MVTTNSTHTGTVQPHTTVSGATHPRERLIQTAATLVHQQGWTATGINQILSEAGIPKGSFYYYFRSKEALGVAVLQKHHEVLKAMLERTLDNVSYSPDIALYELLREMSSSDASTQAQLGCPISTLGSEVATQSPALLNEANQALEHYQAALSRLIRRAQKQGMASPAVDPEETAQVGALLLQGAFHAVRRKANLDPLATAHAAIHQMIFGKAATQQLRSSEHQLHALAS